MQRTWLVGLFCAVVTSKRPITFEDVQSGRYSANTATPHWISPNSYLELDQDAEAWIQYSYAEDPIVEGEYKNYLKLVNNGVYASAFTWVLSSEYTGYVISPDALYIAYYSNYKKEWRHSFNATWSVYTFGTSNYDGTLVTIIDDVQHFEFAPGVSGQWAYIKNNDIFIQKVESIADPPSFAQPMEVALTEAVQLTNTGEFERIFNGRPDWVYEEEVISGKDMLYWSPSGTYLAYATLDDSEVKHIQYQVMDDPQNIYPRMDDVAYPKPGTTNPVAKAYAVDVDTVMSSGDISGATVELEVPMKQVGDIGYVFHHIDWFKSSERMIVWWLNRVQNDSVPLMFDIPNLASEKWGSSTNGTLIEASRERSSTGWVGNHGPFPIIMMDETDEYYFQIMERDGYFHVHLIYPDKPYSDMGDIDEINQLNPVGLTYGHASVTKIYGAKKKSNSGTVVVLFQAAATSAKDRNVYSVEVIQDCHGTYTEFGIDSAEWFCHSCRDCTLLSQATMDCDPAVRAEYDITLPGRAPCDYASLSSYNYESSDYLTVTCYGNDIPSTIATKFSDSRHAFTTEYYKLVIHDNVELQSSLEELEMPTVQFGKFPSSTGFDFSYEIWTPYKFEEMNSLHPLLVEIYGGPTSQAVKSSWKFGLSSHFGTSNCEKTCPHAIHIKLDARGSGNAGSELMHSVYQKLGWYEKADITEFVRALVLNEYTQDPERTEWSNPVSGRIDPHAVGIWGWSYGGFATTHTMTYGDDVWKCGVSVAALNSRFYYDSIYTEMALRTPQENQNGYDNGTITNMEIENIKNVKFTMIHGTADDNVHFHNGAMISSALIAAGVEFNNYFYADEAHSINYGLNSKSHVNSLIFRKMKDCYEGHL